MIFKIQIYDNKIQNNIPSMSWMTNTVAHLIDLKKFETLRYFFCQMKIDKGDLNFCCLKKLKDSLILNSRFFPFSGHQLRFKLIVDTTNHQHFLSSFSRRKTSKVFLKDLTWIFSTLQNASIKKVKKKKIQYRKWIVHRQIIF